MKLVTSYSTKTNRESWMWAMFSSEPVRRLSMQTTSQPFPSRKSQRWEPMKPAPPVTRTFTRALSGRQDGLPSDRVILEAEATHALRLPEVAPVEDQGALELAAQPLEVEVLELVPLRHQHHRVGAVGRLVGRVAERDGGRQEPLRIVHGRRVVGADPGAGRVQELDDLHALGLAHVVGVGLEGQTQDRDRLVVEGTEGLGDRLDQVRGALAVDLDDRAEELEVISEAPRRMDERVHVLGEAGAAIAQPRLEERPTDAPVEPHALHDLRHIGAGRLADVGDGVDERDLGGEEGVGGVLDDLG